MYTIYLPVSEYVFTTENPKQSNNGRYGALNQQNVAVRQAHRNKWSLSCKTAHIATLVLDHQKTGDSEWYVIICAPAVSSAWYKIDRSPEIGTFLDTTTTPHTSTRTLDFF
ncbi:hypothetical protein EVAR_26817_1 [Eumeta japonica]|uniref:Uncharacterized protein n=1 Tax=Eumeta variegata TaxID=151549 RepID=A0A4C1WCJ0_EUMVA|nr:hypothetical protein EVAR_26817_1 [Eumeta japonica]